MYKGHNDSRKIHLHISERNDESVSLVTLSTFRSKGIRPFSANTMTYGILYSSDSFSQVIRAFECVQLCFMRMHVVLFTFQMLTTRFGSFWTHFSIYSFYFSPSSNFNYLVRTKHVFRSSEEDEKKNEEHKFNWLHIGNLCRMATNAFELQLKQTQTRMCTSQRIFKFIIFSALISHFFFFFSAGLVGCLVVRNTYN